MRINETPGMSARAVSSPEEIQRLRRFQASRYADAGLIQSSPDLLGPDPLADRSIWFAVYGPDQQIWASSRFIGAKNRRLPLFNDFTIDPEYVDILAAYDDQVSEVSRLALAVDAPSIATLAMLVREMVKFAVSSGRHTVLVGAVERPMVHVIRRVLKMPCVVIGPVLADYYNTTNYPIMIDGVRWLADLRWSDPEYWHFFADELVLHPESLRDDLPTVDSPAVDLTLSI